MKTPQIKAVVKEVGKSPKVTEIENELKVFQSLVGGYIEVVRVTPEILMICNEEGKLQGLPPNFSTGRDVIVGTAVFVAYDGSEEFAGLSDYQVLEIMDMFEGAF